jgi:hypothetical protein
MDAGRSTVGAPVSYGIYEPCLCGHRHAEHTLFGTCRACTDCEDDMGRDADDDEHAYVQCECREFRAVEEQIA